MRYGILRTMGILLLSGLGSIFVIAVLFGLLRIVTIVRTSPPPNANAISELPAPTSQLHELLSALVRYDRTHVIIRSGSGMTIRKLYGNERDVTINARDRIRTFEETIALVSVSHLNTFWKGAQVTLTPETRTIVESLLRTFVYGTFGENIGLESHLLPLIGGRMILHTTKSGAILMGEGALEKELTALHEAFRETLSTVRVTSRVLDKRFSAIDVRHDPSLIAQEKSRRHYWKIRETRHRESGEGIFTARQTSRFLLTTNKDLFDRFIDDDLPRTVSFAQKTVFPRETLVAGGWIDIDAVLKAEIAAPFRHFIPASLSGTYLWTITEAGPVRTIKVKSERLAVSTEQ